MLLAFHWLSHVCIAAAIFMFGSLWPLHNILNLPQNVIYDNFIVTAETFVSTVCSCACIHLVTMPQKKKTKEDVKEIITTLENENTKKIANKQLEIHFAKYQEEKIDVRHFKKELIVNMLQAVSTNYDFSMQFKNQMY